MIAVIRLEKKRKKNHQNKAIREIVKAFGVTKLTAEGQVQPEKQKGQFNSIFNSVLGI